MPDVRALPQTTRVNCASKHPPRPRFSLLPRGPDCRRYAFRLPQVYVTELQRRDGRMHPVWADGVLAGGRRGVPRDVHAQRRRGAGPLRRVRSARGPQTDRQQGELFGPAPGREPLQSGPRLAPEPGLPLRIPHTGTPRRPGCTQQVALDDPPVDFLAQAAGFFKDREPRFECVNFTAAAATLVTIVAATGPKAFLRFVAHSKLTPRVRDHVSTIQKCPKSLQRCERPVNPSMCPLPAHPPAAPTPGARQLRLHA